MKKRLKLVEARKAAHLTQIELAALMNSGQLDRSRAISEAILLLSDLHD